MKRLLPAPGLSLALLVTWLMLNNTLDPAHVALGIIIGIGVPLLIAPFRTSSVRLRRPATALRLLFRVAGDIVLANLELARRVLGPESRLRPRFVWVPLDTDSPWIVTTLAAIVTLTPGTLSADLSRDRRHLLVHAFNTADEDALVDEIKTRYEKPLLEIFA